MSSISGGGSPAAGNGATTPAGGSGAKRRAGSKLGQMRFMQRAAQKQAAAARPAQVWLCALLPHSHRLLRQLSCTPHCAAQLPSALLAVAALQWLEPANHLNSLRCTGVSRAGSNALDYR